jgi:hypothetical protein
MPQAGVSTFGCKCITAVFVTYIYVLHIYSYTKFKATRPTIASPSGGKPTMSASDYLLASAEASELLYFMSLFLSLLILLAGAVVALLTNPIWVVKVRLFTTNPESTNAYKGLLGQCHMDVLVSMMLNPSSRWSLQSLKN